MPGKNRKMSAKEFFADVIDSDNTRVKKVIPEEKMRLSPEGNRKRQEAVNNNEFREYHAQQMEKAADEEHLEAKLGVGGYPLHPISYEEAMRMHTEGEKGLRDAAAASRRKKTLARNPEVIERGGNLQPATEQEAFGEYAYKRELKDQKPKKSWAKRFFEGVE